MDDALSSAGFAVINDFADSRTCAGLLAAVNDYRQGHRLPTVERHNRGRNLRYEVIDGTRIASALPMIGALLAETDRAVAERSCQHLVRLGGARCWPRRTERWPSGPANTSSASGARPV
jgi:hypothetical protein